MPEASNVFRSFLPYNKELAVPWYINNPYPQFSKAHLTTLNLNNFKMIEAMGIPCGGRE
jgi:hypothetical protein